MSRKTSRKVDAALTHAVPHTVVSQVLRPEVAAFFPGHRVRVAVVATPADCDHRVWFCVGLFAVLLLTAGVVALIIVFTSRRSGESSNDISP